MNYKKHEITTFQEQDGTSLLISANRSGKIQPNLTTEPTNLPLDLSIPSIKYHLSICENGCHIMEDEHLSKKTMLS